MEGTYEVNTELSVGKEKHAYKLFLIELKTYVKAVAYQPNPGDYPAGHVRGEASIDPTYYVNNTSYN